MRKVRIIIGILLMIIVSVILIQSTREKPPEPYSKCWRYDNESDTLVPCETPVKETPKRIEYYDGKG